MNQSSTFDIKKFNEDFDKQLEEDTLTESEIDSEKKKDEKKEDKEKKVNQFTLTELVMKYRDAMFRIIDILVKSDYKNVEDIKTMLTKLFANENILYLGITFVFIALLGYILTN
jgi:hypothetical protein